MCIWTFWRIIILVPSHQSIALLNGGKASEIDASMFTSDENKSFIGVINVHADNFLFAGNEKF